MRLGEYEVDEANLSELYLFVVKYIERMESGDVKHDPEDLFSVGKSLIFAALGEMPESKRHHTVLGLTSWFASKEADFKEWQSVKETGVTH